MKRIGAIGLLTTVFLWLQVTGGWTYPDLEKPDCQVTVKVLSCRLVGERLETRFRIQTSGEGSTTLVYFEYWIRIIRADGSAATERGIFRRNVQRDHLSFAKQDLPLVPVAEILKVDVGDRLCRGLEPPRL